MHPALQALLTIAVIASLASSIGFFFAYSIITGRGPYRDLIRVIRGWFGVRYILIKEIGTGLYIRRLHFDRWDGRPVVYRHPVEKTEQRRVSDEGVIQSWRGMGRDDSTWEYYYPFTGQLGNAKKALQKWPRPPAHQSKAIL